MPPIPLLAPEYLESPQAFQYTPDTQHPQMPTDTPKTSPTPLVGNCHFATDHHHAVETLMFYHHSFQLSSLCN